MSDIQALDSTKITLEEINLKKEELKEIDESIRHYQDIIKFVENPDYYSHDKAM